MAEWYRRKTRSKNDESEFLLKLGRPRKDRRAQYLRIQAIESLEIKQAENVEAAQFLLYRILAEYLKINLRKAQFLIRLMRYFSINGKSADGCLFVSPAWSCISFLPKEDISAGPASYTSVAVRKKLPDYK
jgi:hypothetical protein